MSSLLSDSERIQILNDHLRMFHRGGVIVLSRLLAGLAVEVQREVLEAVGKFDSFSPENDPYGEHDCALIEVGALSVIWKIDYFDAALEHQSDDPTNPTITRRVMTIMLAEEY